MKSAIRGVRPGPEARSSPVPSAGPSASRLGERWLLGGVPIEGRFVLAPLAGVSDWPFRVIARDLGAPLAYTEMVSSEGLVRGGVKTVRYLDRGEGEAPFAVQLFGADPETMGRAAEMVEAYGAHIVDVNMGCPVKKVCRTGAGAALLQDPRAVYRLVRAMVRRVSIPVQIKVRTGWDAETVNVVEVAQAAEDAGASAIAIHGRTRAQAYEGQANWGLIRAVKEAVTEIKVIGNGDIVTAEDAARRLRESGVDAVMIGRGACGYPWIFREIRALARGEPLPPLPGYGQWRAVVRRHLDNLIVHRRGDRRRAVREFRKHLIWYSRGRRGAAAFRRHLPAIHTADDVERALDRFFPESRHHELRRDAELVTGPLARAWG